MVEDEDLEVLRTLVVSATATAGEKTDEGPDDEVEERPHRPIVLG
jgi:DNA-binding protein YbaB